MTFRDLPDDATQPAATPGGESRNRAEPDTPRALIPFVAKGRRGARASRGALLVAIVALAAGTGAVLGSTGYAGIARLLATADDPRLQMMEEVRGLKADMAQMKKQMTATGEQLGALRTSLATSTSATTAQFSKIGDALERAEKRATAAAKAPAAPETTGSLPRPAVAGPAQSPAKPLLGWTVRQVTDGLAVIEGREGVIEVELGAVVPNLGRVQDIKRENGRWLVVTSRGVITSR